MAEENLKKLYGNLRTVNKKFTRSYEEFKSDMQDEGNRKRLYGNMPTYFPDFTKSFEEFTSDISVAPSQTKQQSAEPQQPAESEQQEATTPNEQPQQSGKLSYWESVASHNPYPTMPKPQKDIKGSEVVRPVGYEDLSDEDLYKKIESLSGDKDIEKKARELYKSRYGKEYKQPKEPEGIGSYFNGQRGEYNAEKGRYAEALKDARQILELDDPGRGKRRKDELSKLNQEKAWRDRNTAEGTQVKLGEALKEQQKEIKRLQESGPTNISLNGAQKYLDDAIAMYNAPSKYGPEKGIVNWANGLGTQLANYDTWTAGATEMARTIGLKNIVERMNSLKPGEELPEADQAKLDAFLLYGMVQESRQNELSSAYAIGKGAAESIPFMAEMFLTAGIGAAGKKVVIRSLLKRGNREAAEKIARLFGDKIEDIAEKKAKKEVTDFVLKEAKQNIAERAARQAVEDVAMTATMPTTWTAVSEEQVDKMLKGEEYGFKDFLRTFTGQTIETGTEHWGGKIVDKTLGYVMPIDKIWGKTKWGKLLTNDFIQSPVGETGEEYIGAIANYIRSFNPMYSEESNEQIRDDVRQMFSPEGLTQTFLTVLPMSVFGGAGNVVSHKKTINTYKEAKRDIISMLQEHGATKDQAESILTSIEGANDTQGFTEKLQFTVSALKMQYQEQHPDATVEEQQKYFDRLDEAVGNYFRSAYYLNELDGNIQSVLDNMSDEERQQILQTFDEEVNKQVAEVGTGVAEKRAEREKLSTGTKPLEFDVTLHHESREAGGKSADVTENVTVSFRSDDYSINDNGAIESGSFTLSVKGKPVYGKRKQELMDAINAKLTTEKTAKDEADAAAREEEERQKSEAYQREQELKQMQEQLNQQKAAVRQSIPMRDGRIDAAKATPEQIVFNAIFANQNGEEVTSPERQQAAVETAKDDILYLQDKKAEVEQKTGIKPSQKKSDMAYYDQQIKEYYEAIQKWIGTDATEQLKAALNPVQEAPTADETHAPETPTEEQVTETPETETPTEEPATEETATEEPVEPVIEEGTSDVLRPFDEGVVLAEANSGNRYMLVKESEMKKGWHKVDNPRVVYVGKKREPALVRVKKEKFGTTVPVYLSDGTSTEIPVYDVSVKDNDGNFISFEDSDMYSVYKRKTPKSYDDIKNHVIFPNYTFGDLLDMGYEAFYNAVDKETGNGVPFDVMKNIQGAIAKWNDYVAGASQKTKSIAALTHDDLARYRAMQYAILKSDRSAAADSHSLTKIGEAENKITGINLQVTKISTNTTGSVSDDVLKKNTWENPLNRLIVSMELAQKLGYLQENEMPGIVLPKELEDEASKDVVTSAELEVMREQYREDKAAGKGLAEYENFPEMERDGMLVSRYRFIMRKKKGGGTSEVNGYDDVKGIYKNIDEAADISKRSEEVAKEYKSYLGMLDDAFKAYLAGNSKLLAKINKNITTALKAHPKDADYMSKLVELNRRIAKAEAAKYPLLAQSVILHQEIAEINEKIEGINKDVADEAKNAEKENRPVRRLAVEGMRDTYSDQLAAKTAELNALNEQNPDLEAAYQEYDKTERPHEGVIIAFPTKEEKNVNYNTWTPSEVDEQVINKQIEELTKEHEALQQELSETKERAKKNEIKEKMNAIANQIFSLKKQLVSPEDKLKIKFQTGESVPMSEFTETEKQSKQARLAFDALLTALQRVKGLNLHMVGSQAEAIKVLRKLVAKYGIHPDFQIIGKEGARRLDLTFDSQKRHYLAFAKSMEREGKTPKEIKVASGWERGADNKWRYEIPDFTFRTEYEFPDDEDALERNIEYAKRMLVDKERQYKHIVDYINHPDKTATNWEAVLQNRINIEPRYAREIENIKAQIADFEKQLEELAPRPTFPLGTVSLSDIIKSDDMLLVAYPNIGNIKIIYDYKDGVKWNGQYSKSDNTITINKYKVRDELDFKSTLVHEIQHAIQEEEGFAKGTNSRSQQHYAYEDADVKSILDAMNYLKDELTDIEAKILKEYAKEQMSEDELFRYMDEFDDVVFEGEADKVESLRGKISTGHLSSLRANELHRLFRQLRIHSEELGNLKKELQQKVDKVAFERYWNHAGEVEARNAEYRYLMDEIERLQTLLSETEDVSRDKQIIEFFKAPDGTIYGWSIGNDIYLTNEGLNPETPIHEYTHIWLNALKVGNKAAYDKVLRAIKARKGLWEKVTKDPAYTHLTTDEEIASEVLARYSGKRGAKRLMEEACEVMGQDPKAEPNSLTKALINKMQSVLEEFWKEVKGLFGIKSMDDISDWVLKDLFDGKPLDFNTEEMNAIKEKAKADGTFMKAPNGEQSKLTEKQWLQVRTKAFKEWYGDWENPKKGEFFLLDENGEPMVVYHGTDHAGFNVMEPQDYDEATDSYVPNGRGIFMTPQQYVGGVYAGLSDKTEVRESEALIGDDPHRGIYSLFSNIHNPLIVDCSDTEGNPSMWHSIPTGQYKIVGPNMETQYFNSEEEAAEWMYENGWGMNPADDIDEPEIVPDVYTTDQFVELARSQGYDGVISKNIIDGTDSKLLDNIDDESLYNSAHDVVVALASNQVKSATQNNGLFSMQDNRIEYQAVESNLAQLDPEAEKLIRKQEDKQMTKAAVSAPDISSLEKEGFWEMINTRLNDQTNGMRLMLNSIKAYRNMMGMEPLDMEKYDVRTRYDALMPSIENQGVLLKYGIEKEMNDYVTEFAEVVEKSDFYKKYKTEVGGENPRTLTPVEFIERYLMARNNWERAKDGNPRGLAVLKERTGYIDENGEVHHVGVIEFSNEFKDAYGEKAVLDLWAKIRKMTDFALEKNLEGGLITKEAYDKYMARDYWVPQRGFWDAVDYDDENITPEIQRRMRNGSIVLNKLDSMHKAEGGKSLAEGCLAYIKRDAYQAIKMAEENKVKRIMFDLLRDNEGWCHEPEHGFKVPKQAYYTTVTGEDGAPKVVRMDDGPTEEQKKEMRRLQNEVRQLKEDYKKAETDEERAAIEEEILNRESKYPYFDEADTYRVMFHRVYSQYDKKGHRTDAAKVSAIVGLYVDGVPCEIEFPPRWLKTADVLNNRRDKSWEVKGIKEACGWLSAQCTMNNIDFPMVNIMRDVPLVEIKCAVEYGPMFSVHFTKNWGLCNRAIVDYLITGQIKNRKTGVKRYDERAAGINAMLQDFLTKGGTTGYSNLEELQMFRNRVKDLNPGGGYAQDVLEKLGDTKDFSSAVEFLGTVLKPVDTGISYLELRKVAQILNEWSEMITRFAAYKTVVDSGLGVNEGIRAAHNLSTNFNRKGYGSAPSNLINSFSVFANASIQGAGGFIRMFGTDAGAKEILKAYDNRRKMLEQKYNETKSERVKDEIEQLDKYVSVLKKLKKEDVQKAAKKLVKATSYAITLPAILGFICTMLSPDDDEDEYRPSDYVRDNYFIIGNIRKPLNEQLKPSWVIGVNAAQVLRGRRDWRTACNSILTSIVQNWLPFPQNVTTPLKMMVEDAFGKADYNGGELAEELITPSFMVPIMQWADNEGFLGNKLRFDSGDRAEWITDPTGQAIWTDLAHIKYLRSGGNPYVPSKTKDNGEMLEKNEDVNPREIKTNLFWVPSGAKNNFALLWALGHDLYDVANDQYKGTHITTKDIWGVNRVYSQNDKYQYRWPTVLETRNVVQHHDDRLRNLSRWNVRCEDIGDEKGAEVCQKLIEAEAGDVTANTLKELLETYDEASDKYLQKYLSQTRKELDVNHPDEKADIDLAEKGLVKEMRTALNLKNGVESENKDNWLIKFFDEYSPITRKRNREKQQEADKLINMYIEGITSGDKEKVAEAKRKISKFNEAYPSYEDYVTKAVEGYE